MSSIDDWAGSSPASGTSVDQWAGTAQAMPDITQRVVPGGTPQPGMAESALVGFGQGVGNTALGIEQLAGKGVRAVGDLFAPAPNLSGIVTGQQPRNLVQRAGDYLTNDAASGLNQIKSGAGAAEAAHPFATGAGNIVGSTLATAPLASLGPGGLIAKGVTGGALASAAQPVDPNNPDFWTNKLEQSAVGGVTGGLGAAAVGGLARSLAPAALSPAAADLAARGVRMTPGQMAGGQVNKLEQQLTSVPFVGQSVADARNRAIGDFNRAVYSDALAPIGQTLPDNIATGGAGVEHVGSEIGKVYDGLESQALFNYDGQFHRDLQGIRSNMLAQGAPQSAMDQFDNIVRGNITNKMNPNTGELTGTQWGQTRSQLNTIVRNKTLGQPSADDQVLAHGVDQLGDAVNANVVRNSPPGVQTDLTNANAAYARYKRLERAAGYTGARNSGNVFTPAQYGAAVGAGSTAAQKGTNTGLNAALAQNAQQVLGTTVPDSGTAGRGWLTSLLLAPHLIAHPGLIAGGVGARAAYSPTGIRALNALATQRPAAVRALGNAIAPLALPTAAGAGAASGGALGGLLDYEQ